MLTLDYKLIPGPLPTRLQKHPAAIAYNAGWQSWIPLECENPECKQHWNAPANKATGEPDIAIWGRDIIKCPHCGFTALLFITSESQTA